MVPCSHQGNIYVKKKLRVWRDQKCMPLLGAKNLLTCAGRQTTPSQCSQYRPKNGSLRKLGWTYCHGTVFAPRQYLFQKDDRVWSDQKCMRLVGARIPLTCADRKLSRLKGGGIGSRSETCVNWGGLIAMVPYLH